MESVNAGACHVKCHVVVRHDRYNQDNTLTIRDYATMMLVRLERDSEIYISMMIDVQGPCAGLLGLEQVFQGHLS